MKLVVFQGRAQRGQRREQVPDRLVHFVLYLTGFILSLTGFILNLTGFILNLTGFILMK